MNEFSLDRRTALKLAGATALSGSFTIGTATAQEATTPFEVEGPISSITDNGNETGTITAMGLSLTVDTRTTADVRTTLTSPSGYVLSLGEVSNTARPLPGRDEFGFVGGTVKGAGEITSFDPLELVLTDVTLEPAENVVFGVVTANDLAHPKNEGDILAVNGMPIAPINDRRMKFPGYTDAAGTTLQPSDIPLGTLVAAEGYYSDGDDALRVFTVELDFVADTGDAGPSLSIARAEYRPDKGRLRVRGAASDPSYQVAIANVEDPDEETPTYERIESIDPVPVDEVDNSWSARIEEEGLDVEPEIVAQLGSFDDSGTWNTEINSAPFEVTVDN